MKLILFILCTLTLIISGCVAGATSKNSVTEVFRDPRTGEEIYRREMNTNASAQTQDNPAGPTTISTGADGETSITLPASQEKPLAAYGLEQRQLIFFGSGALLIVIAAVAFWWGQRMLAACLAVAAAVLFAAPKWIDIAAGPVGVLIVLVILAGVAWWISTLYHNRKENVSAIRSWLKLQREGQTLAAGAALRESPLARKVIEP